MGINISIVTAIIGILSVLLGVTTQYYFTRRVEFSKHYQDRRTQAYVDFIKATAGMTIAQRRDATRELEFVILMADARARIGIYGSRSVAAAMADFLRNYHGALVSPPALASFVGIVTAMRSETPSGEEVIEYPDMGQLLFDRDVKRSV